MKSWLENIKNYHRPLISILFAMSLIVVLIGCAFGAFECADKAPSMTVIGIMGSWLGVYAIARSGEKIMEIRSK